MIGSKIELTFDVDDFLTSRCWPSRDVTWAQPLSKGSLYRTLLRGSEASRPPDERRSFPNLFGPFHRDLRLPFPGEAFPGYWLTKIKSSVTNLKVLWHYYNDVIFYHDEKQKTTFESRSVYKPIAWMSLQNPLFSTLLHNFWGMFWFVSALIGLFRIELKRVELVHGFLQESKGVLTLMEPAKNATNNWF